MLVKGAGGSAIEKKESANGVDLKAIAAKKEITLMDVMELEEKVVPHVFYRNDPVSHMVSILRF